MARGKRALILAGFTLASGLLAFTWHLRQGEAEPAEVSRHPATARNPLEPGPDRPSSLAKAPNHRNRSAPPIRCLTPVQTSGIGTAITTSVEYPVTLDDGAFEPPLRLKSGLLLLKDQRVYRFEVAGELCTVSEVNAMLSIWGQVVLEDGTSVEGALVRAQCESPDQEALIRTTHSTWDGFFVLDVPDFGPQSSCSLTTIRGLARAYGEDRVVDPTNEDPVLLIAAPLQSPLSESAELACEEAAVLTALFGDDIGDTDVPLDPWGEVNWTAVALRRELATLPACGTAVLTDDEERYWLNYINGKGPRPESPEVTR